ncbi:unnamed protein product [Brassica napus]|uniref:(rape) hypothetical protein n=1 Tax=Brassica napus TaxID=3708 RepID=A0A816Y239_BRANA|nr:unnamed protein product [Brassica napus]
MLSIGATGWATPCLRSYFLDSLSSISALEIVSVQTLLILSNRNNSIVRRGLNNSWNLILSFITYQYHFAGPVLSKRYGLHFLFMPLSFVVSLNKQASVKRGQSKGKKKSERESTELTL